MHNVTLNNMSAHSDAVISCRHLSKTFTQGNLNVPVLTDINLDVARGERIAIVGSSGSGKSTLLHLLGGLDNATSGSVSILGQNVQAMNETDRGTLRNRSLGFVYQFHHLLAEFTALENVAMPLLIRGMTSKDAEPIAMNMLSLVGLNHRVAHMPSELSGGERQRVAVCRALINRPALLLADEPTGNLDRSTAEAVGSLLLDLNREQNTLLICVTHSIELAHRFPRHCELQDGRLVDRESVNTVPVRG